MRYNIMLAAGSRVKGAKSHSSEAERLHSEEIRQWVKSTYKVVNDMPALGCMTLELTEAEVSDLRLDYRVHSVSPALTPEPSKIYTQTDPPWQLKAVTNSIENFEYRHDGRDIIIYIVDDGLDIGHFEFEGRASRAYDYYPLLPLNGSHGTIVAGLAAGKICGTAKQAKLVSVRVMEPGGSGEPGSLLAGLNWIITNHPAGQPAVVNMSLGLNVGVETFPGDLVEEQAILALIADGLIPIVAAGNEFVDAQLWSPARMPEAVTVGAYTEAGAMSSFSNFGVAVDIFAPGSFVLTSVLNGLYELTSGTSTACPIVSGAVACYLQQRPQAAAAEVLREIKLQAHKDVLISNLQPSTTTDVVNFNMKPRRLAPTGNINDFIRSKTKIKPYNVVAGAVVHAGEYELQTSFYWPVRVISESSIQFKFSTLVTKKG